MVRVLGLAAPKILLYILNATIKISYRQQYFHKQTMALVDNKSLSVSMDQCLWMKVAVGMCVLVDKSRLREKLGHH